MKEGEFDAVFLAVGAHIAKRAYIPAGGATRILDAVSVLRSMEVPGLEIDDRVVKVVPNMMTGYPGIFAAGDMVPSERTVTVAVGHGKTKRHIDAWLNGRTHVLAPKHELAGFDKLNTWYYGYAPKTVRPMLDSVR